MEKGIKEILKELSPDARKALYILSVPNLLCDSLANILLMKIERIDEKFATRIIEELRFFPIWHNRTINSWVFDDDVREYLLETLKEADLETRLKIINVMREYLKDITNSPLHSWEFSDYFLQFARLSISIDENRTEGIAILRQIFDIVFKYDQFNSGRVFELERIIDVYLEEIFPDVTGYDKNLTDEISGAYFMRGLCAMKNKNFGTAFKFLVCVSDNDKSLLSRKYGISVESIIKRVLKETNHIPTDKQFNLFERKVFENNIYGKQNHETLPNLCTEKSKIYSVIGDFR